MGRSEDRIPTWGGLRELSDEFNSYARVSPAEFFKKPVDSLGGALAQIAQRDIPMAMPDQRAVKSALTEHNGMFAGRVRHSPKRTDDEVRTVLESKAYSRLRAETSFNGSYSHITGSEFVSLLLWGGDEFFDIFEMDYGRNEVLYAVDEDRLYALLASDWHHDRPVDICETVLVLLPYWWSMSDSLLSLNVIDMAYWGRIASDGSMREIAARRKGLKSRLHGRNETMRHVHSSFRPDTANGLTLGWFILGQVPFSDRYSEDTHTDYVRALVRLQEKRNVHEVSSYIAAGVDPDAIDQVIINGLDIDIALSMSV